MKCMIAQHVRSSVTDLSRVDLLGQSAVVGLGPGDMWMRPCEAVEARRERRARALLRTQARARKASFRTPANPARRWGGNKRMH